MPKAGLCARISGDPAQPSILPVLRRRTSIPGQWFSDLSLLKNKLPDPTLRYLM